MMSSMCLEILANGLIESHLSFSLKLLVQRCEIQTNFLWKRMDYTQIKAIVLNPALCSAGAHRTAD